MTSAMSMPASMPLWLAGPTAPSARGAEGLQLRGKPPADDLVRQQSTGDRSEGDSPHPVATRRIHPRRTGRADERQAVRRAGPRTDPLVLPRVQDGTAKERPGSRGDGLDPALVEARLGRAELHHARHAEP